MSEEQIPGWNKLLVYLFMANCFYLSHCYTRRRAAILRPKAAHAVAAALVQITNTAANPAVTQDVSKEGREIVELNCDQQFYQTQYCYPLPAHLTDSRQEAGSSRLWTSTFQRKTEFSCKPPSIPRDRGHPKQLLDFMPISAASFTTITNRESW